MLEKNLNIFIRGLTFLKNQRRRETQDVVVKMEGECLYKERVSIAFH